MAIRDQMKRTVDVLRSGQSTVDLGSMVAKQEYQDTGGWAYADMGDGRIKITASPPTSKLKPGAIIDPANIAEMADGPAKDQVARAYNSIRGVMMGAAPLEPIPTSTMDLGSMVAKQEYQDTGGWAYADMGDGRIKITASPPTSKLKPGAIIDPANIAKMADGPAKYRAARAYNSIRGVMMGAAPLEPIPTSKKPAGSKAPPVGGAQPSTAARPGELRGGEATPADATGPGISKVAPPPAVPLPAPGMGPRPRTTALLHRLNSED